MTCHEIAQQLLTLNPDLTPVDIARLSLLVLAQVDDPEQLRDEAALIRAWKRATFRLESASDQHAAVASELDALCSQGSTSFSVDQLRVLLRAVKVQSQILELYTAQTALA